MNFLINIFIIFKIKSIILNINTKQVYKNYLFFKIVINHLLYHLITD